jgi:hypothetical protein
VSATSGRSGGRDRERIVGCGERVGPGAEDRLLPRVAAPYFAGFVAARMIYEEFEEQAKGMFSGEDARVS